MPIETRRGEPTPPIAFGPAGGPAPVAGSLARRLRGVAVEVPTAVADRLAGACSIDTADAHLDEASRDWWPLALGWSMAAQVPARPALIARPASTAEVAAVLRICNEAVVPVTPAGGRSGVCGASIPVFGGVALDLTAMSGIVDVDDASLLVRVRPGMFGDVFEDELRAAYGLSLGHWPQSMALSTVGGWLACRSAGQYSTRYGKIEDMVAGLEVVLADGTTVVTGSRAPRAAVGPDLTQLFVGSEGTLGVVTGATLRVHPLPSAEERMACGFTTFTDGLDACRRILRRGATPAVLRLYDRTETARTFKVDTNALVVLDEGDAADVSTTMGVVRAECAATPGAVELADDLVEQWMGHRNDVSALPGLIARGVVLDTVEVAARWSVLDRLYDDALRALRCLDGMIAASAHQSHAYPDGACLYFTWASLLPDGAAVGGPEADTVYRRAWDAVTAATLDLGGALSHHHGVGLNRSRYVERAIGAEAAGVLHTLKAALDPRGILNPGKLGLPSPWGDAPWGPDAGTGGEP